MTRINSAIPVQRLTDEHLLAEHREIKRLPYCLQEAIRTGSIKRIPEHFVLGKGHVTFFLDKQQFVYNRYIDIHSAVRGRGFNVQSYIDNWSAPFIKDYWSDYAPTDEERKLLIKRITDRIIHSNKQTWHYYGHVISKEEAARLLEGKIPDSCLNLPLI